MVFCIVVTLPYDKIGHASHAASIAAWYIFHFDTARDTLDAHLDLLFAHCYCLRNQTFLAQNIEVLRRSNWWCATPDKKMSGESAETNRQTNSQIDRYTDRQKRQKRNIKRMAYARHSASQTLMSCKRTENSGDDQPPIKTLKRMKSSGRNWSSEKKPPPPPAAWCAC